MTYPPIGLPWSDGPDGEDAVEPHDITEVLWEIFDDCRPLERTDIDRIVDMIGRLA